MGTRVEDRTPTTPTLPAGDARTVPAASVLVRRLLGCTVPLAWGGFLLAWLLTQLATGTPAGQLVAWTAAVSLGVVLPGVVVVRAVRPAPASLVEDLAWSAPAGFLVALAGWAAGVALPWSPPPALWGIAVAAVPLAVSRRLRRKVLSRPVPGWSPGAHLGVVAALAVALIWMTSDYLALNPADPGPSGRAYYPDTVFQLAVLGQVRHHWLPDYPFVSGEPFAYHWFLHAGLAYLSSGSAVDPWVMVVRLVAPTLLPAVVVLCAVIAWRVSSRMAAGPIAAGLLTVVGTTVATDWTTDGESTPTVQTFWWASQTSTFGWLATLATAGCVLAVLCRGTTDRVVPTALLIPFAVLAAGAKSADLAVLVPGMSAALVVVLLRHRARLKRALLVWAALVVPLVVARQTIYGGSDYGLRLDPGGPIVARAAALFPGLAGARDPGSFLHLPEVSRVAVVVTLGLWLIPLLPRLAGLAVLLRRRPADPVAWFFVGTLLSGVGGALVFRHPASSEALFLVAAYPVALMGSAWGLAELLAASGRAHRRRAAAVGLAGGLVVALVIAGLSGPWTPLDRWTATWGHAPGAAELSPYAQAWAWAAPLVFLFGGIAAIALVAVAVSHARGREGGRGRGAVATAVVAALLGPGLLSTALYATRGATAPSYGEGVVALSADLPVTRDELTAGRWLAAHARPDDVLLVNRWCLQRQVDATLPDPCVAKSYAVGAVSGLSVDVGAWAFASRNLDSSWSTPEWYAAQPFWDQPRLNRAIAAVTAPTRQLLEGQYRAGARWVVADLRSPVDITGLDRLADRVLTLDGVDVWRLRPADHP